MTYDWQAPGKHFNAVPGLSVSVSWSGVWTTVRTTADPATFGETVETSMTMENVMSETIPSYNCTIQFDFSPGHSPLHQYAVNSVSSTCVTEPTPVWCKSSSTNTVFAGCLIYSSTSITFSVPLNVTVVLIFEHRINH